MREGERQTGRDCRGMREVGGVGITTRDSNQSCNFEGIQTGDMGQNRNGCVYGCHEISNLCENCIILVQQRAFFWNKTILQCLNEFYEHVFVFCFFFWRGVENVGLGIALRSGLS